MVLYHGSDKTVEKPAYGAGKKKNDYGPGFYTTRDYGLACEWSVSRDSDGFVNSYEFDTAGLSALKLADKKYSVLHWLTILVKNRTFDVSSSLMREAMDYLVRNFSVDTSLYDYIVGWRADDSYFSFARDFLSGSISLQKLSEAMRLGKLGLQYVLTSPRAFEHIKFTGAEKTDHLVYYQKRQLRDEKARADYKNLEDVPSKGIYMVNILQEEMGADDKRLYL